jgi:hypothetical protein
MSDNEILKVADFSRYPAGRDAGDGDFNGLRYRHEFLQPALERASERHGTLLVSLEGVLSFGSSFLEEAFGGLVREGGFSKEELHRLMKVYIGKESLRKYEASIWKHIESAVKKQ